MDKTNSISETEVNVLSPNLERKELSKVNRRVSVWIWLPGNKKVRAELKRVVSLNVIECCIDNRNFIEKVINSKRVGLSHCIDRTTTPVFTKEIYYVGGSILRFTFSASDIEDKNYIEHTLPARITVIEPPFTIGEQVYLNSLSYYSGTITVAGESDAFYIGKQVDLIVFGAKVYRLSVQLSSASTEADGRLSISFNVNKCSENELLRILQTESQLFSYSQLKYIGVSPYKFKDLVKIKYVESYRNFETILNLRRIANQFYGRQLNLNKAEMWSDYLDESAIHISVKLGHKIVGAVRLLINSDTIKNTEIGNVVELPSWLLNKKFVEVSRLVVHPDYRSSYISIILIKEISKIALDEKCDYILLDSIEKLRKSYERLGAKTIPGEKQHPYSNEKVHIMTIDVKSMLSKIDIQIIVWIFMFGSTLKYYVMNHGFKAIIGNLSPVNKLKTAIKAGLSYVFC
jgi:predicted GNAT family N-acyltransferase